MITKISVLENRIKDMKYRVDELLGFIEEAEKELEELERFDFEKFYNEEIAVEFEDEQDYWILMAFLAGKGLTWSQKSPFENSYYREKIRYLSDEKRLGVCIPSDTIKLKTVVFKKESLY